MATHSAWLVIVPLLLLMQVGFTLLTSGLCRAKNAGHIVSSNLTIVMGFILAFWIFGFAVAFGGIATSPMAPAAQSVLGGDLKGLDHESLGIFGGAGFFFTPFAGSGAIPLFVTMALVLAMASVIPAAAMAERWGVKNIVLYSLWSALPIALLADWVWGGGWLSHLGATWGMGHGVVDFAGSSVVHLTGGVIAFTGASILGPRAGKYTRDGRPKPMPGHNLVFVVVGALLLFVGWFAFNSASPFSSATDEFDVLAINTLLAGAAGGFTAYLVTVRKFSKADPSMLCNGMLAGLVAISAPCAFVNPVAAVLTGIVAGAIVVHSVLFFESKKIDDPVGAISVHGICGIWGLISLGLFANGRFGMGWNGLHTLVKAGAVQKVFDTTELSSRLADGWTDIGVTGAFGRIFGAPASDWGQLGAQLIGIAACLIFVGAFAFVGFKISNAISPMRVRRDTELGGLDLPETGAECYPDFHLTDKSQSGV